VKLNLQNIAVAAAGAAAAGWILDQFVIKYGPDDPTGFIEQMDGFGVADVVIPAGYAAGVLLALQFFGSKAA
jgi:hypothetical protein